MNKPFAGWSANFHFDVTTRYHFTYLPDQDHHNPGQRETSDEREAVEPPGRRLRQRDALQQLNHHQGQDDTGQLEYSATRQLPGGVKVLRSQVKQCHAGAWKKWKNAFRTAFNWDHEQHPSQVSLKSGGDFFKF